MSDIDSVYNEQPDNPVHTVTRKDTSSSHPSTQDNLIIQKTSTRTLTAKGLEYNIDLKRKLALDSDRKFHTNLVSYESLLRSCCVAGKIKQEISIITAAADSAFQISDEWIALLQDPIEVENASYKQQCLIKGWKTTHATAWDQVKRLENVV